MDIENVKSPLVSVGLPVFNGEKGIATSLELLLKQDYNNLEIIISDNGSTDRTSEICKEFLKKDPRIKYYRSPENRGSNWNFNQVFDLSSGKYFMWAKHDDKRELSFVRSCVKKLEKFPEAVLCQAHTAIHIENRKERLGVSHLDSFNGLRGLTNRYRETLKHHPALAIYGVYRVAAMKKTHLIRPSIASDVAFIQELSIHGSFVQVPKILFTYTSKEEWKTIHDDYENATGKGGKPWWHLPFVILFYDHWSRVAHAELSISLKLRLWSLLIDHEVKQIMLKVLIKVCGRFCPTALKEKLACAIYDRWMQSPNLKIDCKDLFLDRNIKPSLGWWRN